MRPIPWVLLGLGLGAAAAARAVAAHDWYGVEGLAFPGSGEAYGVLAYPALFVATIGITSDRRRARDLLAGSEPIIYVIALTALVWMAVTGPYVDDGTLPLDARGMDLGVPAARRAAGADRVATDQSQRPVPPLVPSDGLRVPGLGRGPRRRRLDRLPGRLRARHAAGGGDRRRSVAARDLRYPAGHPSPDRRIRRSIASSLDADLRFAVRGAGAARRADPDAGHRPRIDGVVRRRRCCHGERDRARPRTHVAPRRPGPRPHRAARSRPVGGDGRALERRGDARRPDGPCQLRQPRSAGDARLQPRELGGPAPARRRQRGGARRARSANSNGSSSSATAARSSSRRR